MRFYIAGRNKHKIEEMRVIIPYYDFISTIDLEIEFPENGTSFIENSISKAFALWNTVGQAVIADDSGLCVDSLNGRPGVFSARYGSDGGQELESEKRNTLLLEEMQGKSIRTCRFVCALACILSKDRIFVVQETCDGVLLDSPRGQGGFGYDPIVFLPDYGKTMAELPPETKNLISHRAKALKKLSLLFS
jgi:XTP/dITP diphosphohydrolase